MLWSKYRRPVLLLGVVGILAVGFASFSGGSSAQTTFPGSGTGAIPDGTSPCWNPGTGAPREVTFNATGLSGAPTAVDVSVTFGAPNHSFVGDITCILIAPNGASHTLFGHTLATTATAFGDSSDLAGPYIFSDAAAAPPNGGWWQAATAAGATVALPTGTYRTTNSGGAGATNPQPPTNMNAAFSGVANPNGTWTLRLTDSCAADTGAVSAASLTITAGGGGSADAPLDYNGDGKTDFVVVRNIGGGDTGQIRWFYNLNGTGTTEAKDWGIGSDFFLSGNIDGDNNDDIIVWRSGAPGVAAFYALKSTDFTALIELFGQTGDDPTVLQDYNNDGKTDWAVYRSGAAMGNPSTWFWRNSQTPGGAVNYIPWGVHGDFPAPGDYDGDGNADFVVQRPAGGQAAFWRLLTTDPDDVILFGTPGDIIVPGDYDGDGKDDIAVVRDQGGSLVWYYEPSGMAGVTFESFIFGNSATDYTAQGDYDGDGRTDAAIWRPNATPGASAFWTRSTATSAIGTLAFGQDQDYPVGDFNAH